MQLGVETAAPLPQENRQMTKHDGQSWKEQAIGNHVLLQDGVEKC